MAAAILVSPSLYNPLVGDSMAASIRRQPLMSIPNATNSPHRALTNSGSKRSRATTNGAAQQENEPPSKRQAVDKSSREPVPITPRRQPGQNESVEGKVFERGTGTPVNSFQKRLVAARDKTSTTTRGTRTSTTSGHAAGSKEADSIRQWQKHYRKLFPTFHIFFDSIQEETKARFIKQIRSLGAREEQFFSSHVTHIVTSRPLPDTDIAPKAVDTASKTVNPSVLDLKNGRSKKDSDILVRGMQMGMKVWTAEKLQKMLSTLFDGRSGPETNQGRALGRVADDLVQVLKNEKLAAAADKQNFGMPREFVHFKGPFIYVHDMDEKWKPTMIREYAKVARRSDGDWPQFRSASIGKCPFVEDPVMKRELERERAQQHAAQLRKQRESERRNQSHENAAAATQAVTSENRMNPPRRTSPRKILRETHANTAPVVHQTVPAKAAQDEQPDRQSSFPPMPEQPPVAFVNPGQMLLAREPAASGIQKSAMTSAIQSQMISSAAATGMKASTSKEVNELKRKVLERTHTGSLSVGSISSSHQVNALLKNTRAPAPQRAAKSRAQEKLGGIQEEVDPYADDIEAQRQVQAASRKKKAAQRDPKPGYCENCHDKYDDFEDHILSRKHRKFATTASNWTELDALLAKLQHT